jgi:hypothetical protein
MITASELFNSSEKGAVRHIRYITEHYASGEIDLDNAIDYIGCLIDLAHDSQEKILRDFPKASSFGVSTEGEKPSEKYLETMEAFAKELSLKKNDPEAKRNYPSATSETDPLTPMTWNYSIADLGYVFEALQRKKAINAGSKEFASHFLRKDGSPMPSDLTSASKGEDPKNPRIKEVKRQLLGHNYQDDDLK